MFMNMLANLFRNPYPFFDSLEILCAINDANMPPDQIGYWQTYLRIPPGRKQPPEHKGFYPYRNQKMWSFMILATANPRLRVISWYGENCLPMKSWKKGSPVKNRFRTRRIYRNFRC